MPPASRLRSITLALSLALACPVSISALAREAGRPASRPAQTVEPAPPVPSEPPGAWTAGSAPADCTRARRKLWQAGEGWIVKTITTCH